MNKQLVEELKDEVKSNLIMMRASSHEPMEHLKLIELIDVIQRLGIAYHFEQQIEEALQHIYVITSDEHWIDISNNLQSVSLWFRVLRQNGFNVSSGNYYKFTIFMFFTILLSHDLFLHSSKLDSSMHINVT